jgi:hypothetical protein
MPGRRCFPTYSSVSVAVDSPNPVVDGAHAVYFGSTREIVAMMLTPFGENANPLVALESADTRGSPGEFAAGGRGCRH